MKLLRTISVAGLVAASAVVPAWSQDSNVSDGTGAVIRGLDKLNAETSDMTLQNGGTASYGTLRITLKECRYPTGDPSGDAYAFLTIDDTSDKSDDPIFQGWMVASSPALNALDHIRFDVWVLRCTFPEGQAPFGHGSAPAQDDTQPAQPATD